MGRLPKDLEEKRRRLERAARRGAFESIGPGVLWASIDTLSRPDGSLAASTVVMNDGTSVDSTFAAANVGHVVTLRTGETVRVHTEGGSQTFYVGADDEPLLQSKWSPTGPRVVRTRRHLAFLNDPLDPPPGHVRPTTQPEPKPVGPVVIPTAGVIGLSILVSGVSALYEMFRAAPEAMGAGDADAQIITYKTWTNGTAPSGGLDDKPLVVPVFVGSLTAEQAQDACPLLPQVSHGATRQHLRWQQINPISLVQGPASLCTT